MIFPQNKDNWNESGREHLFNAYAALCVAIV